MNLPDYGQSPFPVRDDLVTAHQESWRQISQPGANWTAIERVHFVEESRQAAICTLCQERKQALSPATVKGEHIHLGHLPLGVVEIIHKMSTDPGRISRKWFDDVMVMAENEKIRANRLALLSRLRTLFLNLADISRL